MPLVAVYEENLKRVYKASTWSTSNFWRWISEILIVVVTLILAFVSQGFWKKTNAYLEQPAIHFDKRCLVVLSGGMADPFDYYFWSPYVDLNRAQADRLIMPVLEIKEDDFEQDTVNDQFFVDISFQIPNESFTVRSVFWMLYFKATLKQHALVDMNGVIFGELERLTPAKSLSISADLQFWQRKPLPFSGHYNFTQDLVKLNETEMAFGSALYLPVTNQSIQQYQLAFRQIQRWETSQTLENSTFTLNFKFVVPEQLLIYRSGALELLKWVALQFAIQVLTLTFKVWIQYFALSILVRILFDGLTSFLFQNHLLESVIYVEETKTKVH
ncbi:hypothetical protein M3Y97_00760900 [Aphelenchoides bicaudatus]|nr:hypothetical protein M3Y97_00760900 [Aphelenchoides bicaudatus]